MSGIAKLKISYYPIPGRSLPARAVLAAAGIDCEFEQLTNWSDPATNEDRKRFPLGDIPVLEVKKDGSEPHVICETIPVYHYAGTVSGYWPKDPLRSTQALEQLHTFEQIVSGSPWDKDDVNFNTAYYRMEGEAKEKALAGCVTRRVKFYLSRINDIVAQWGKEDLNVCDVHLFANITAAKTGAYWQGVDFSYLPELTHLTTRMELVKADAKLMAAIEEVMGNKK